MGGKEQALRPLPVVVVEGEVPAGGVLVPADLEVRQMPQAAVPAGTFSSLGQVEGKVASVSLVAGQVLYRGDVRTTGRTTYRYGLKPGEAGVLVPVNLSSSGAVVSGERVYVVGPLAAKQPAVSLFTGLRVVMVLNGSASGVIPGAGVNPARPAVKKASGVGVALGTSTNNTPTSVELAVPAAWQAQLIRSEELGVVLTVDPTDRAPGLGTALAGKLPAA